VGTSNTILDIGCGDGLSFDCLSEFGEVSGIEADPLVVNPDGPDRNRITIGTFGPEFACTARFSLMLMLDVLEHLDDPLAALRRAAELLQPNGLILIAVPALPLLWTSHDDLNEHRTRYTQRRLLRLVAEAGFHVNRCFYFFHWLALVKLATRLKEHLIGSRPAPPRLWPWPLNSLLYGLCVLEQPLSLRLPMPLGSSLMVACRRADWNSCRNS
jgi:SAM-dependent methyltransferase